MGSLEKRKMGRPTKYRPEISGQIIAMMREGASKVEVCAALDISRDTFYRWKEEYPEFSDTVAKGELLAEAWWTRHGRENLYSRDFNHRLFFNCMKNMFGWSERSVVNSTAEVVVKQESADLDRIMEEALKKVQGM